MNTYCIRSTDRSSAVALLIAVGALVDGDDGLRATCTDIVWDEIGPISDPTGEVDGDGLPVMALVTDENGAPYWHANVYAADMLDLPPEYLLVPSEPRRVLWL